MVQRSVSASAHRNLLERRYVITKVNAETMHGTTLRFSSIGLLGFTKILDVMVDMIIQQRHDGSAYFEKVNAQRAIPQRGMPPVKYLSCAAL